MSFSTGSGGVGGKRVPNKFTVDVEAWKRESIVGMPLNEDRACLLVGDCRERLRELPENSIDAVVTDPPYNLGFMGKAWDTIDGDPVDAGLLHWLAGFTDGEGCFHIKKNNWGSLSCEFYIQLRADDRPVLERLCHTLRLGTVSHQDRPDGQNPMARWVVRTKAECLKLRSIFRDFPLRAKKARDFQEWACALDVWVDHKPGDSWQPIAEAKDRLHALKPFAEKGVHISPFRLWCADWAKEAFRVLKPGGWLIAASGTRTYHHLAAGIEDAGFEIRDMVEWVYLNGFPKSLDVAKAIDKVAGHWRGRAGAMLSENGSMSAANYECTPKGAPVTAAAAWDGWGTALKPAHEPFCVARKPLTGTVAKNMLEHGTGALNIGGCKVGDEGGGTHCSNRDAFGKCRGHDAGTSWATAHGAEGANVGRWPANLILGEGVDERLAPYFYCPKASRREREEGCEGLPVKASHEELGREEDSAGLDSPRAGAGRTRVGIRNVHPT